MNIREAGQQLGRHQRRVVFASLFGLSTFITGCEANTVNAHSVDSTTSSSAHQSTPCPIYFGNEALETRELVTLSLGNTHNETGTLELQINPNSPLSKDNALDVNLRGQCGLETEIEIRKSPNSPVAQIQTCVGLSSEQQARKCILGSIPNQNWSQVHTYKVSWSNWNINNVSWDGRILQIIAPQANSVERR